MSRPINDNDDEAFDADHEAAVTIAGVPFPASLAAELHHNFADLEPMVAKDMRELRAGLKPSALYAQYDSDDIVWAKYIAALTAALVTERFSA